MATQHGSVQTACRYLKFGGFHSKFCLPMTSVCLQRGQKCYATIFMALFLVPTYYVVIFLMKPTPVPGSIVPSPNFKSSQVERHVKPVIMVTYPGRMANHMFQYATLIGVAKRNNMIPVIPDNIDLLDIFKISTLQGTMASLEDSYYTYAEEKSAGYFSATERLKPFNTLLYGYYQSWKYFENVQQELLTKHFVFKDHIANDARSFLNGVLTLKKKHGAVLIGVHVRRGDFVRLKSKGYTTAPLSYFYRAMNYFRGKYSNVLFIVCSNDIVWAEDNLDIGPDVFYSSNVDGGVDLAVLASCGHMIITSGSYSWWAGYLVPGEVVYFKGFPRPNTVIGNQTVRADYYPKHWNPM